MLGNIVTEDMRLTKEMIKRVAASKEVFDRKMKSLSRPINNNLRK